MRIKRVLVLVFLLMLYVVPANVSATELGTSDQSITSFSEETGWQHDFSNTTGITNTTAGDTVTSDGDIITLTSDLDGGSFEITVSSITTADYPFLVLNCTSISSGDGWKLEQLNTPGGTWYTLQSDYATTTGIYRYNMKALSTTVETLRINITQTATIKFDFVYAYVIADFDAYTNTGNVGDYFHVDNDILYCTRVTSVVMYAYMESGLLSEDTSVFDIWNCSLSSGAETFGFGAYVGGWVDFDLSEVDGSFDSGTLDRIRIRGTASFTLSTIIFSGFVPSWEEAGEAVLIFEVPFDYWALNMGLIFGGLIIMLVSVCLMAVKIRDRTITRDAGILLLFLFCVGWGLFIGGTIIG